MDLQEQYEKLLRYCYMKTGDRTLAEDIVQEAYLRYWQKHQREDTAKDMAYLYVIARNLCMDEFRRPKTEDIDTYREKLSDGKYESAAMAEHLAVEEALEKLPEELKEAVVLRYMDELKVSEIARILGMSRFAVHRRIKEGLALLKKALGGEPNA